MGLRLNILEGEYSICRLDPDQPLPEWALGSEFWAMSRSENELSVVCREADVPAGTSAEPGWRCLQVQGPLEFSLVGVLASLVAPLAEAEISVFAISTFDTDYLLVKQESLAAAQKVLTQAGHQFGGRI